MGRIQKNDFSISFCLYSNLFSNNLKFMIFVLFFHLCPSALNHTKQITKINFFSFEIDLYKTIVFPFFKELIDFKL